jgi:hypothetical protein
MATPVVASDSARRPTIPQASALPGAVAPTVYRGGMGELRCLSADAGHAGYTVIAALPAVVLLPAGPATGAAADAVWRAATAPGASLESVVSSIPTRDPALDSFLVLWFPEDAESASTAATAATAAPGGVIAVARGSAAADIRSPGGARRFGSLGALPWRMAEFGEVESVVAGRLPPLPESRPLVPAIAHPVGRVVVTASTVYWTASPGDAPLDGIDEATVITRTRPRAVAPVVDEPIAEDGPDIPRVRFQVTLPGGARELDRPIVIGRRPVPRPGSGPQSGPGSGAGSGPAGTEGVALVTVASPTGVISGSHVEIAHAGSTAVVTDLRSTNGTMVTLADGSRVRLRQGDSVAVATSARVDIGDGVVLRIAPIDDTSPGRPPHDPLTAPLEPRT